MKKLVGLVGSALLAIGCSGCATTIGALESDWTIPGFNSTLILSLDTSFGSGCAVSPTQALTAFHVTHGEKELHWRNRLQEGGIARVQLADAKKDLALVVADGPMNVPFLPIAQHDPRVGEELWVIGLFKNLPTAYHARAVALDPQNGDLILDSMGFPGSSGGCVVNLRGELVAIFSAAEIIPEIRAQRGWTAAVPVWGLKVPPAISTNLSNE